ncbi:MAG TPA: hypothetical protein VK978_01825 [Candidatus Saccharimonadales bacterium]|nr:hypothetical protein [Candidatus Saccharimonadales bacterium]
MNGKLILVSGLSGSGKTTLIGGALQALPELVYIKTYTTRPMRASEESSHEYVFVDEAQYSQRRQAAIEWDHTEYAGFKYGADAGAVKAAIGTGKTVICSVAPDLSVIEEMAKLYIAEPITFWIKVPKELAKQRVYGDDIRDSRSEDIAISTNFDQVFEPVGNLEKDIALFVDLLRSLMK